MSAAASLAPARQRLRRESLASALIFTVMLYALSLLLMAWRTEQLLTQLAQERVTRLVHQVALDAERSMRLGMGLSDQAALPQRLARLPSEEPLIQAATLLDEHGAPLFSMGQTALLTDMPTQWTQALLHAAAAPQASALHTSARTLYTGVAVPGGAGTAAGAIWVAFQTEPVRQQARQAALRMLLQSLPLAALTFMLVWWMLQSWSARALQTLDGEAAASQRSRQHFIAVTFALLALSIIPLSMVWIARESARPHVTEQLQSNADAIGHALSADIERALRLGIPWDRLNGVPELFERQLRQAPELDTITLKADAPNRSDRDWHVRADSINTTATTQPLEQRSFAIAQHQGTLSIGFSSNYVDGQLRGMVIDLVLAFVIATVLMRELTRGLWRQSLLHLLAQHEQAGAWRKLQRWWGRHHAISAESATRDAQAERECMEQLHAAMQSAPRQSEPAPHRASHQLTLLRLAVFLVALSEELLRPFFTVFASNVQAADSRLSPAMVAGWPVAAFMATLALTQVLGPTLARRVDPRWSLMAAALAGTAAMLATAFAADVYTLVALRALAGAAYGLGFIIAQTAVVRITSTQRRARGLAELSAAIVAAGIVGPPFGGMIAARAGDAAGFAACALCLAAAALVALRLGVRRDNAAPSSASGLTTTGGWRGYVAVLREPRAIYVILGAALPARLVAVTVLSVVVPLYMSALHQPAAVAGRVLLLYFLVFAASATFIAHWSDLTGKRLPFIAWGGLLSVVACVSMVMFDGVDGMALCCALLGLGQALQSAPQIALVTEVFDSGSGSAHSSHATPEQALAAFRFMERAGSIASPFVTAIAIALWGYAGAVLAVGMFVGIATLAMMAGLRTPPVTAPLAKAQP